MIEQNTKSIMGSVTNQLKKKKQTPKPVSVFYYCNSLQVHWMELLCSM